LGMPVCSRLGRRSCLLFAAALYVLGAVLQLVDFGDGAIWAFEVGRVLNGLGVGVGTLGGPM
jgi:MFS family permease